MHLLALLSTTLVLAASPAKQNFTLQDLSWLSGVWKGTWTGKGMEGPMEESWSTQEGGSMVGVFRLVDKNKFRLLEACLLEQTKEGVFYRFRHFGPGLKPWEETAYSFKLIKLSNQTAVFECPGEQNPRRLIYSLKDPETLFVRVEGTDPKNGFDLTFKKVKE